MVVPGKEDTFFNLLLDNLKQRGVRQLDLKPLRPDSTVLTHLTAIARTRNYEVGCRDEGISVEMDLPAEWEEYLATLVAKQRHEVKRKLRRLSEAGDVGYRCVKPDGDFDDSLNAFFRLFALSQPEKAGFMTRQMESFFRDLAGAMAETELLRFGIMELDKSPIAMIMSFDFNDTMYLYNSAYDPDYRSLSAGLMSKVLCIKESIEQGKKKWDFLKGSEIYKYHLGGQEVPLYNCQIMIR